MALTISIVIPAYNASQDLSLCLDALHLSSLAPLEILVVDDGSTDDTAQVARNFGVTVLSPARRNGPAYARNLGAREAQGDVLFFLDADVRVKDDTVARVAEHFQQDATLDAVIGSYDSTPASKDFISQYRNLMHAYVHGTGAEKASTFWSGCGAIRRSVFMQHSGFSESYKRPAIEDIELGYRLITAKRNIILDRSIEVTHLKHWSFWSLVKTDMLDRGIPWTELILRDRHMPNDLNLQLSQRVSVALVFIFLAFSGIMAILSHGYSLLPLFALMFLMLGHWWGEILHDHSSVKVRSALMLMMIVTLVIAYRSKMYGLMPPLIATPMLLVLRHRYGSASRPSRIAVLSRTVGLIYIGGSAVAAVFYLPVHRLMIAAFVALVLLALLNIQFYVFLAGKRGLAFMLAAMPFHLLYHLYNGISFLIGIARHSWRTLTTVQSHAIKSDGTPDADLKSVGR